MRSIMAIAIVLSTSWIVHAQQISASLFFVVLHDDSPVPAKFFACEDPGLAGPFLSAATAIEFRDEFIENGEIISGWSTDDGICNEGHWFHRGSEWTRD